MGPNREENVNQKHILFLLQSLIPEALQSLILEEPEAEGRLGMGVWGANPPLFIYGAVPRPPRLSLLRHLEYASAMRGICADMRRAAK